MYDAKFVYGNSVGFLVTEDKENKEKKKKKVVALLSGGLASQLAVRMMQEQGFDVSAVAIKTPF